VSHLLWPAAQVLKNIANRVASSRQLLISSRKTSRKNTSPAAGRLDRTRSVLTCCAMSSVAGPYGPAVWVFSISGFHRRFATRNQQAERWSGGDHSSIWDSWPIAFSGYPRGPRVGCETMCPRYTAPNLSAETRSRTRVSRDPDGHRQRKSPAWSGLGPRHSSCLWFQILGVEAHSFLPNQQRDRGNFPC
jgi:hypothetical protein